MDSRLTTPFFALRIAQALGGFNFVANDIEFLQLFGDRGFLRGDLVFAVF